MAIHIKSIRDKQATPGEKAVLAALKRLEDDCIIYSQPELSAGYPDFVVIIPDIGVYVIEVKGCMDEHALAQAKRYLECIRDELKLSPFLKHVISRDGGFNGFSVPFGMLVTFTNTARGEMDAHLQAQLFPKGQVLAKGEWVKASERGDTLRDAFRAAYPGWRPVPRMEEDQIAVVRSVISRRSIIDSGLHLKLLDLEQENLAHRDFGGHRLVYGPAGTGKTIVLIARAKFLASKGKRCLVLCYNALLADELRNRLASSPELEIRTFHSWAARHDLDFNAFESDEELGSHLRHKLPNGPAFRCYDAVLVDEIQVFPKEWCECIMLALKGDHQNSELFLAGDFAQTPKRGRFSWKEIGIQVVGGSGEGQKSKKLTTVYRCPRGIFETAEHIRTNSQHVASDPNYPATEETLTFKRLGPQPEITRLRSRAEEIRYVTNRVETLLLAGFKSNNVSFPVNAREVAIVYPPEREVVGLLKNLEASLARVAPVSAIKGGRNQGALSNDTLKIISLLRVRGLQFPHIILVFTDSLNSDWFNNVGGSRFWLSIAMTRAEQSLTILHSADCDLIDELQESLCRFKSS